MPAPTPTSSSPSFLESIGSYIWAGIAMIPTLLLFLLEVVWFLVLSVLVVPSMIIMLTLHKKWEGMFEAVTNFQWSKK